MKMNRFRVNLHPALFEEIKLKPRETTDDWNVLVDYSKELKSSLKEITQNSVEKNIEGVLKGKDFIKDFNSYKDLKEYFEKNISTVKIDTWLVDENGEILPGCEINYFPIILNLFMEAADNNADLTKDNLHYPCFDKEWSADLDDEILNNIIRIYSSFKEEYTNYKNVNLDITEPEPETPQKGEPTQDELENIKTSYTDNNLIDKTKHQRNKSKWTMTVESDKTTKKIEKKENNEEKLNKELEKQLVNLAKNKKIDFDWTDNKWNCDGKEKELAISSAKVFAQVLGVSTQEQDNPPYKEIFKMCKERKESDAGELTKQEAKEWKTTLWINSKEEDIQNFYKAFLEYKNRNTQYIHLQGLMDFFEWLEGKTDLQEKLKTGRSQEIKNKDIKNRQNSHKLEKREGMKGEEWKDYAKFNIIQERVKNKNSTEKVLALLCDFNFDWEINTWDVWYRTWTQFAEVFNRELARNDMNSETLITNLVAYANKMWLDIQGVSDIDSLYDWMTKWSTTKTDHNNDYWYERTKKLQYLIQNSSADFSDILINGENAGKETLNAMLRVEKWVEGVLEAKYQELLAQAKKELEDMDISEKDKKLALNHITNTLAAALADFSQNHGWGGIAFQIDLIKGIKGGFYTWVDGNGRPVLWFGIWYGWRKDISDNSYISTSVYAGTQNLIIPCVILSAEFWTVVNGSKLKWNLKPEWEKTLNFWGNFWIYWPLPTYWFSAWYEYNKKGWIEKEAKDIHNVVKDQTIWLVDHMSKIMIEKQNLSDLEQQAAIKEYLKKAFKNSADEDLNSAAINFWKIMKVFEFDENTSWADKETYANVIADVFTEQWRNNAIIGITDNKWKITWWKLWIQFYGCFIPAGFSLALKFTKYRNARTVESSKSELRRVDAIVNWVWNRKEDLWNNQDWEKNRYLWENEINKINSVLKQFWVTEEIRIEGGLENVDVDEEDAVNISEPRIIIPTSIWEKINVRVSQDLKWCVQQVEGGYSFPANATYRLFVDTWWNQKSTILNVGWEVNKTDDVDITKLNEPGNEDIFWTWKLIDEEKDLVDGEKISQEIKYKKSDDILKYFDNKEIVDIIKNIDGYLTTRKGGKESRKLFSKFMKNHNDAINSFEDEKKSLIDVINKYVEYMKGKKRSVPQGLLDILKALKDKDIDPETQQLIMDRFLAISAKIDIPNKTKLTNLMDNRSRKAEYKKLTWPNGKPILSEIKTETYKKSIKNLIGNNITQKIEGSIIWATAFYHPSNDGKWLWITWLWVTSVLEWSVKDLEADDQEKAKNWFLWYEEGDRYVPWVLDKDKSPNEWNNMKSKIEEHIKKATGFDDLQVSEQNLKDLLRWEEVEIGNIKIKLDVKYVFYLMWECANESVGMQLWNLTVQSKVEVDRPRKWEFITNFNEATNIVDNDAKTRSVGVAVGINQGGRKQWSEVGEGPTGGDDPKPNWDDWNF